jgi:hypothetical protein
VKSLIACTICYANYGVGEKKLQSLSSFWNSASMLGCHKQKWHWLALEYAIEGMFHVNIRDGLNKINYLILKIVYLVHMIFETSRGKNVAPLKYPWMSYVKHILFKKLYGTMWDVLSYDASFKDHIVVPMISWIKLCSWPKFKKESQLILWKKLHDHLYGY